MISVESKFTTLSFESYFSDSVECFKSISTINKKINLTTEDFYKSISFLKQSYRRSTEEEKVETKVTFGMKIKNFFYKIWGFFVQIFRKVQEIVIYLVKSLIIFIQKKRIQMNSIFKLFEKDGGLKGYNNINNNIIERVLRSDIKIKTLKHTEEGQLYTHEHIKQCLTGNSTMHEIINKKITCANTKSALNLKNLKEQMGFWLKGMAKDPKTGQWIVNENGEKERDQTVKFQLLNSEINRLYFMGVVFNESPDTIIKMENRYENTMNHYAQNNDIAGMLKTLNNALSTSNVRWGKKNLENLEGYIGARQIDNVSHFIVLGDAEKKYDQIDLSMYFNNVGGKKDKVDWNIMHQHFDDYYKMSEAVIGKDGYIEKLEKTMKEYNKFAKEDADTIKKMNDEILEYVNKFIDEESPYAKYTFDNFKTITDITTKIKQIKTHFIRFRQTMILDIITLYSIENKAWWMACGRGRELTDNEIYQDTKNIADNNIIMRPDPVVAP